MLVCSLDTTFVIQCYSLKVQPQSFENNTVENLTSGSDRRFCQFLIHQFCNWRKLCVLILPENASQMGGGETEFCLLSSACSRRIPNSGGNTAFIPGAPAPNELWCDFNRSGIWLIWTDLLSSSARLRVVQSPSFPVWGWQCLPMQLLTSSSFQSKRLVSFF